MILLAIDTAGPRLQLALLRRDGEVDVSIDEVAKGHAEIMFGRIAALLERNGIGYGDLTRVGVTTGPGSFTGLRIGMSAARGLGLALAIPVIGVPTLLAISLEGTPFGSSEIFSVALPAGRGATYYQDFSAPGVPEGKPILFEGAWLCGGQPLLHGPFCDVGRLARFARTADPAAFQPVPTYIREADAKPQEKARVALKP